MHDSFDSKPLSLERTGAFQLPGGPILGSSTELFLLDLLKARSPETRKLLEAGLSPQEQEEALQRSWSSEKRLARAWVRRILGYYLGIEPQAVDLQRAPGGKPWVPQADLHFNLSHSGPYLLFAISARGPLGCDMEVERPRHRLSALLERVFSKEEQERIRPLSPEDRLNAFYRSWTLKEAYVKAVGKGIALGLENVVLHENHQGFLRLPQGNPEAFRIWHRFREGIHLALVAPGPDLKIRLWDATGQDGDQGIRDLV